jgi:hypothetical protein
MKFTYYTDCGHGWVRVKKQLLIKLGIENKITGYSYMRKDYVYLEEDCDLHTFEKALFDIGIAVILVQKHTNKTSKIRNYFGYRNITTICAPSHSNTGNYIYTKVKSI